MPTPALGSLRFLSGGGPCLSGTRKHGHRRSKAKKKKLGGALCPWRQLSTQHPLSPSKDSLLRTSHNVYSAASPEAVREGPSGSKMPSYPPYSLGPLSHTVFGGLVWILIASSLVPLPLAQGWVMFVSVFCFVATTSLMILYIIGTHGGETSWITLDAAYHCVAALFYLSASVLEALATISMFDGFTYKHYHENIAAVVFAYVVTLIYVVHAVFSLIRWKSS